MKSLLLLILPLMTGGEVTVNGCPGGMMNFTCKYLGINSRYTSVEVVKDGYIVIKCDDQDYLVNKGRFSVMLDTNTKEVKVAIRDVQEEDFGNYECKVKDEDFGNNEYKFHPNSDEDKEDKVKLRRISDHNCKQTFIQTAYRTADTTISCDNTATFICKYNSDSYCEDILSRNSRESNGPFTLTETTDSFRMSISNVSPEHAGVYFCGHEERGLYRVLFRKIQLQVEDIKNFTRFPPIGQTFKWQCENRPDSPIKKFICKGEDPSICEPLVSTTQKEKDRFSMIENQAKTESTITVRDVTPEDTGTYWCGAESVGMKSNPFFHRLEMNVVLSATGGSWVTVTIVVVVCVTVLVFLIISALCYKRLQHLKSKSNEDQNNKDHTYEEIEESHQKPGSGVELKTIYATASAPTNPSATEFYSTINLNDSSGKVSGDMSAPVRDIDQNPTCSTVNHPSRLNEDPFYSTVNMPQQH